MYPENLVPTRSDIQGQLVEVLKTLPPQSRGRKGIENAIRNRLKAKYKDLPAEDIDKVMEDLPSYQGFPKREVIGRQV